MDIDDLMTKKGMRSFTDDQRDTWVNDAVQIRQLAQIIEARLANTHIEGDSGDGQARRRARRFAGRLRKVADLLERAAARTEGVNAAYVRDVLELPERRASQTERKALRRQRLGIAAGDARTAVQQSLAQSASALNGAVPVGSPQVNTVPEQPRYTPPNPWNYTPQQGQQGDPIDIANCFQEAQ